MYIITSLLLSSFEKYKPAQKWLAAHKYNSKDSLTLAFGIYTVIPSAVMIVGTDFRYLALHFFTVLYLGVCKCWKNWTLWSGRWDRQLEGKIPQQLLCKSSNIEIKAILQSLTINNLEFLPFSRMLIQWQCLSKDTNIHCIFTAGTPRQ